MMLLYEPLIGLVEMTLEKRCHETRKKMGLNPIPGLECDDEPCKRKCPYKGVKP